MTRIKILGSASAIALGTALIMTSSPAIAGDVCQFAGDTMISSAPATRSLACGYYATASAPYAIAFGPSASASGAYSSAYGDNTRAAGNSAVALGNGAYAKGNGSSAVGLGAYAGAKDSIAAGDFIQTPPGERHTLHAETDVLIHVITPEPVVF